LVTPTQLPAAIETVRNHPDVRFVLDHGAKPLIRDFILEPWARHITVLAASPNVAVKLSGLVTRSPRTPDHGRSAPILRAAPVGVRAGQSHVRLRLASVPS